MARGGSLPSLVREIVQPKDAADDSSAVIDAEEVLLLSLDVVDDRASDRHSLQQPLIAEDEKDFAALPPVSHHVFVQFNTQIVFFHLSVIIVLKSFLTLSPVKHVITKLNDVHGEV